MGLPRGRNPLDRIVDSLLIRPGFHECHVILAHQLCCLVIRDESPKGGFRRIPPGSPLRKCLTSCLRYHDVACKRVLDPLRLRLGQVRSIRCRATTIPATGYLDAPTASTAS